MKPEDALRRALHEEAGQLPPPKPEELDAIAGAAARRRLRRLTAVGAACAVVVGAVAFAGGRPGDEPSATDLATRPADSGATSLPAPAPTEPARGDDRPAFAVALSAKGRVVVLDGATSRALQVLAQYPTDGSGRLGGVSLTPDRKTVYYGYGESGLSSDPRCGTGVYRVPVDGGGRPEKVAEGLSPKLSPDGRLLAYAGGGTRFGIRGEQMSCSNVLVIRDLASGAERAWVPTPDDNYFSLGDISSITWAPDSKRLAFEFSYEDSSVLVVDAAAPGGRLEDLRPLVAGQTLFAPAWRSDGRILVRSMCCHPDWDEEDKTLLVDPVSGQATPFTQVEDFAFLDFDSTGRHLLFVKEGENGELFRKSEGENEVFMARDFLEADW